MSIIFEDAKNELIGIFGEDESYDKQILRLLNSFFGTLQDFGVGNDNFIVTATTTWDEFKSSVTTVTISESLLNMVKDYILVRMQIRFDPPQNSFLLSSLREDQKELEWRINSYVL